MKGFYVLGTSYGVGATTVSVALLAALKCRGVRVAAYKPVEVGCGISAEGGEVDGIPGGALSEEARRAYARLTELVGPPSIAVSTKTASSSLQAKDAERLARAVGGVVGVDTINRARFSAAIAPALASRLAGRELDLDVLEAEARHAAENAEVLVVDGCGGALEPLACSTTQRDFVARLELAVVVVGTTEREATNDVLMSLDVLKRSSVDVAGVVLIRKAKRLRPEEAAVTLMIDEVAGDSVCGVLPYLDSELLGEPTSLGECFERHVDVSRLMNAL